MKEIILCIFIAVFFHYGCDSLTGTNEEDLSDQQTKEVAGIEYRAIILKTVYSMRDTLEIRFSVRNNSDLPRQFSFSNIQQLCFRLINIFGKTAMSYPWIISPALSSFSVAPGQTKTLSIKSLFKNFDGIYIDKGTYLLIIFLADNNSPELELKLLIE